MITVLVDSPYKLHVPLVNTVSSPFVMDFSSCFLLYSGCTVRHIGAVCSGVWQLCRQASYTILFSQPGSNDLPRDGCYEYRVSLRLKRFVCSNPTRGSSKYIVVLGVVALRLPCGLLLIIRNTTFYFPKTNNSET